MSLSSLPEIFCESRFSQNAPRKQGVSFSLHLNPPALQRHLSSRSQSNSKVRNFATLDVRNQRSISSSALKYRETGLSEEKSKRNTILRIKNQKNSKSQLKALAENSIKKEKGLAVISLSNVFYETSRQFNNKTINLEQADSLKNATENNLKQISMALYDLQQVKNAVKQAQVGFREFSKKKMSDLQLFQQQFIQSLSLCYSNLSKLRRQTNDQTRGNKKEFQKITTQLNVCQTFLQQLCQKGQQLYKETIKTQNKLESLDRASPQSDYQQISQIPPYSSRGGTGVISRRTRFYELQNKNDKGRKSAQWKQLADIEIN